ncbi:hypothetical protein [Paenibacillus periandrae]|uniref:hypothetical protein n=1 Tax=Paenibacillus periandrae TaxID=1761741 RepID=UPI001F089A31|nr:hypothetical protein [Paenibacillus periandrae]
MFKRDDELKNPIDFDNVIFFSVPIEVYIKDGSHVETGMIESHTEYAIFMNGGRYLKENCRFKVGYKPNQTQR